MGKCLGSPNYKTTVIHEYISYFLLTNKSGSPKRLPKIRYSITIRDDAWVTNIIHVLEKVTCMNREFI